MFKFGCPKTRKTAKILDTLNAAHYPHNLLGFVFEHVQIIAVNFRS
jgi:hypothetical protein